MASGHWIDDHAGHGRKMDERHVYGAKGSLEVRGNRMGRPSTLHLDGGDGADIVDGGIGNDRITGGLGRDIHRGGPGADHLASRDGGPDSVDGGPGADSARIDRPFDRLTNVEST